MILGLKTNEDKKQTFREKKKIFFLCRQAPADFPFPDNLNEVFSELSQ